jgi:hypothetical protein
MLFSSFTLSANNNLPSDEYAQHAQAWSETLIKDSSSEDIQLIANIVYLLYANALIDIKIHQFIIPITQLTQTVKANIANYKKTADELKLLRTLIDRLIFVTGARTIYNQQLKTCIEYADKNISPELNKYIQELELYGQIAINQFAQDNTPQMEKMLDQSARLIQESLEPLQVIANFHTAVANGSVAEIVKNDESIREVAASFIIDRLCSNNRIAIQHAENILNTLDSSTVSLNRLIFCGAEICKQHYVVLYNHMNSHNFDPSYAVTLFGMNNLLEPEYASLLPHPDKVFEHVLETIKLYTHVEVIQ